MKIVREIYEYCLLVRMSESRQLSDVSYEVQ